LRFEPVARCDLLPPSDHEIPDGIQRFFELFYERVIEAYQRLACQKAPARVRAEYMVIETR
jgi:hypothetical protein